METYEMYVGLDIPNMDKTLALKLEEIEGTTIDVMDELIMGRRVIFKGDTQHPDAVIDEVLDYCEQNDCAAYVVCGNSVLNKMIILDVIGGVTYKHLQVPFISKEGIEAAGKVEILKYLFWDIWDSKLGDNEKYIRTFILMRWMRFIGYGWESVLEMLEWNPDEDVKQYMQYLFSRKSGEEVIEDMNINKLLKAWRKYINSFVGQRDPHRIEIPVKYCDSTNILTVETPDIESGILYQEEINLRELKPLSAKIIRPYRVPKIQITNLQPVSNSGEFEKLITSVTKFTKQVKGVDG